MSLRRCVRCKYPMCGGPAAATPKSIIGATALDLRISAQRPTTALGKQYGHERIRDRRVYGLRQPDRQRGLYHCQRRLGHRGGGGELARVFDDRISRLRLANERAANGHAAPYRVKFLGIGNENEACGGAMTAQAYVDRMKTYSLFVRNVDPAQGGATRFMRGPNPMMRIAVSDEPEYTEAEMKAWQHSSPQWAFDGISVHKYTGSAFGDAATGFGEKEYARFVKQTYEMDDLIVKRSAMMDQYDPKKTVALVVDEWGVWVKIDAGDQAFLSPTAKLVARCHSGLVEPEHLCAPRRSCADDEHCADGECSAIDDPDRRAEDAADADLPRLQNVCAVPGCSARSDRCECRSITNSARRPCPEWTRLQRGPRTGRCGSH